MIEFAKITGELDENNYLEVQIRTGEHLFAPFVVMGNSVSLPSKTWIESNKDNFLALVTYEKDMYISPMIIGFYPVKGANSSVYNTHERLLKIVAELVDLLKKARINTQIGPQKFMPDTQLTLDNISEEISLVDNDINKISL